jgi:hypothetical protein
MAVVRDEDFAAWQQRVRGTNISEQSLLATDYLNHFSEIVMLLELVADMPDCIEEVRTWEPKGYREHFRDSTFSDRELAIAAYDHVPDRFKVPFEEIVAHLHGLIATSITRLDDAAASGMAPEEMGEIARAASRTLQRLMDHASAVIHGSERGLDQAEIDALLGGAC